MRSPTLNELPPPPPGKTGWPWTEATPQVPDRTPDGSPWPRISIVTPSYNQGQFIEETIRSVLLQGYADLEYIIVDGGSTDETVEIIKAYAEWLKYWVSEEDDGQADAINKGLRKSSGHVFGYINSDDVYQKSIFQTLAKSYRSCVSPNEYCGVFSVVNFDENKEELIEQDTDLGIDRWIRLGVSLHQPGVFWSINLLNEVGGFDNKYQYAFDRKFFMQLVIRNIKFAIDNNVIAAKFRIHASSKSFQYSFNGTGFSDEFLQISTEILKIAPMKFRLSYRRYERQVYMSKKFATHKGTEVINHNHRIKNIFDILKNYPDAVFTRFFWGMLLRSI